MGSLAPLRESATTAALSRSESPNLLLLFLSKLMRTGDLDNGRGSSFFSSLFSPAFAAASAACICIKRSIKLPSLTRIPDFLGSGGGGLLSGSFVAGGGGGCAFGGPGGGGGGPGGAEGGGGGVEEGGGGVGLGGLVNFPRGFLETLLLFAKGCGLLFLMLATEEELHFRLRAGGDFFLSRPREAPRRRRETLLRRLRERLFFLSLLRRRRRLRLRDALLLRFRLELLFFRFFLSSFSFSFSLSFS